MSDLKQALPDSAPAPAKKLQKIISEPENQLSVNTELNEKIQLLDEKLANIDLQLQEKGIKSPVGNTSPNSTVPSTPDKNNPDTQARLQAIKDHIANKAQQ